MLKIIRIGQSATKFRTGEGSTTIKSKSRIILINITLSKENKPHMWTKRVEYTLCQMWKFPTLEIGEDMV